MNNLIQAGIHKWVNRHMKQNANYCSKHKLVDHARLGGVGVCVCVLGGGGGGCVCVCVNQVDSGHQTENWYAAFAWKKKKNILPE